MPFGKYLLLKRLAVGGMAELYLARDTKEDRLVVIKRILPYLAQEAEFVRMFLDEARIAAQLHHPHIISVYELGSLDGSIFIAMEYVEGVDLRKILQQEQKRGSVVPPNVAAWFTARLCEGLHYAHNRTGADGRPLGIIHRDVSPQNLMIGYRGEVKLVDFGIAKATAFVERSKPGVIKGKFLYLSPEQLSQERIDHRSDLFAVGTMLYEIVSGKSPFFKPTTEAVIYSIRAEDPPPLHIARPGFPGELSRIVSRCLLKDRTRRYQQAGEVHADLEAWLAAEAPTTGEDVIQYVARLFGGEEERTVLFLPGKAGVADKAPSKPATAERPAPRPSADRPTARSGNQDKVTAKAPSAKRALATGPEDSTAPQAEPTDEGPRPPEGRRPTPESLKNPFDDDDGGRTQLAAPDADDRPTLGPRAASRGDNSISTVRTHQERKSAPAAPRIGSDDFVEPTTLSQPGVKNPRESSSDSLGALTPDGLALSPVEPTKELPEERPRSSRVFDVPPEFSRDEVPSPRRPRRAEPEETKAAPPSSPRGPSATLDDSIGELLDAAVPSMIRNREVDDGGTVRQRAATPPPDLDDLEPTADERVSSSLSQPSVSSARGGGRRTALWVGLGAVAVGLVLGGGWFLVSRGPSEPARVPVGPRVRTADAGAVAVAAPAAEPDSGEPAGPEVAPPDGDPGGGPGSDPGTGGGSEPVDMPVVDATPVFFDAPKNTVLTLNGRKVAPRTTYSIEPGELKVLYQCYDRRRRRPGTAINMVVQVPRQAERFTVKFNCR